MAPKILNPYLRLQEAAGVSIHLGNDGQLEINVCRIKASGNQLNLLTKVTGLNDLRDLTKNLSATQPIALNLSGKGVLIKQTEKMEEVNAVTFPKILPNANLDDFYVQNFISGERSFVALVRKTEADNWLARLASLGYAVLQLSFGPFVVHPVLPQLNFYNSPLLFSGHEITLDDQGNWQQYRFHTDITATFPIKLESEKLDEKLVVPYAAAFQLILARQITPMRAEVPALVQRLNTALSDQKIKVWSLLALGALFVLLLFNFLLFSHYNAANARLAESVGRTSRTLTDGESLKTQIKQKEALLDSLGREAGIRKSVLVDQLAQLLPPDLHWQKLAINPEVAAGNAGQGEQRFVHRRILITGDARRIVSVNEWISRVRSLRWVKNVQLTGYTYHNEEDNGQFTITINY